MPPLTDSRKVTMVRRWLPDGGPQFSDKNILSRAELWGERWHLNGFARAVAFNLVEAWKVPLARTTPEGLH